MIGALWVLGIILLILKLAGVIAWAWWIVLIPFYSTVLGLLIIFTGGCAVALMGRRKGL